LDATQKQLNETQDLLAESDKHLTETQHRYTELEKQQVEGMPANSQLQEDLQRRFEMAVDDVRQLKRRIAEMEEEQSQNPRAAPSRVADDGPMDWESTKKRLLAELENDANQPADKATMSEDERLTVEGAIRITDQMVIERDQQIEELRQ